MATGVLPDQKLEKQIQKQMGCMTGFFQMFDRHQILNGKRIYTTKRLTASSPVLDSSTESDKSSGGSPLYSDEQKSQPQSPYPVLHSPAPEVLTPVKMTSPLPVFDTKESIRTPWKLRESPRLSLDSRATVDGKGSFYPREIQTESMNTEENNKQRRPTSVIAKLMGLDTLPDSGRKPIEKAELRRSASESRVSRDLQYRFIDCTNSNKVDHYGSFNSSMKDKVISEVNQSKVRSPDSSMEYSVRKPKIEHQQQQRKVFYDSADFFPDPKQNGYLYGEIERRLKMRGIDEPEKDLETLKQILEALQLKGLLHSNKPVERFGNRNYVFDPKFSSDESQIILIKPSKSQISNNNYRSRRTEQESISSTSSSSSFRSKGGNQRNMNETSPVRRASPNPPSSRNSKSPDRRDSPVKSPSSLARRKPLNIETQKRGNDSNSSSMEQRRSSPVNSPIKQRANQTPIKSPRNRKVSTNVSPRERYSSNLDDKASISTSSPMNSELQSSKMEGRTLLERCDKLLNSIAEITTAETDLQPSPVSVLDSSFYKDESSPSPSPLMRRRFIDFKDHQSIDLEDDTMSQTVVSPVRMKFEGFSEPEEDSDFTYISEILRVSDCLSEDTEDVFLLLEKGQYNSTSKDSMIQRKLIFDTITEILDRKRQLLPWKLFSLTGKPSFRQIWTEFKRIREKDSSEDLLEIICGALKKDMNNDSVNGWIECPTEISEAVLDIERLIFKDLIAETIKDLASPTRKSSVPTLRRTLVF